MKLNKQRIIAGLSSVALFLMLANPTWDKSGSIISYQFSELGAGGMFVALVVGIYTALIMEAFGKFSFLAMTRRCQTLLLHGLILCYQSQ